MRLMKRLTDKNKIIRVTLQSLPAVLAAIVIVIYGLTFVPLSHDRMRRSTALVEYVSCYEIDVDGRPVAWFRAFGDSLSPLDLTVVAGQGVVDRRLITGVWANRYEYFPSCHGRILIPSPDVPEQKTVNAANRRASLVVKQAVSETEKLIKQLDSKASRLHYYLSTHNVSDGGYNTMAAYSASVDSSRNNTKRLLAVLKDIGTGAKATVRHIEKYTLLHTDEKGNTLRTECNSLTNVADSRFRMIQTVTEDMPDGAVALYFHRWLAPSAVAGTRVITAACYGSALPGFSTKSIRPDVYNGLITRTGGHNVPRLFAPDGSPCFTHGGQFIGLTVGGAVFPAKSMKFGFNDLLK